MSWYGPLSLPDPGLHVPAAYALSTGQSLAVDSDRVHWLVGDGTLLSAPGRNETVTTLLASPWHDPGLDAQRTVLDRAPTTTMMLQTRANQYPPLPGYLPQAAGMLMARHAGGSAWDQLQAGRVANLLCYMLAGMAAVLLAGGRRWAFVTALANPACVFLASSMSADAMAIAVCALVTALAMRLTRRDSTGARIAFVAAGALLVPLKLVYATLLLLPLPARSMTRRARATITTTPLLLGGIPYLLWSRAYARPFARPGLDTGANLAHLLAHPAGDLMQITASTAAALWQTLTDSPPTTVAILLVCLTLPHDTRPDPAKALTASAAGVLSLLMTTGMLLITWNTTPDTGTWTTPLTGFQERYLLPLLTLPAYTLENTTTTSKHARHAPAR
ncbi:DUF2142 domain-containing protein [Bifidobacterium callitrichos]|uniref:DUF2142 domain-containing protein n=1 Tax=Bifidobacterium callitrichos TaxID=762209 RepID=UPI0005B76644|nr:DUF2142 domain-containing protein [Bifidobacterium callitrichos]